MNRLLPRWMIPVAKPTRRSTMHEVTNCSTSQWWSMGISSLYGWIWSGVLLRFNSKLVRQWSTRAVNKLQMLTTSRQNAEKLWDWQGSCWCGTVGRTLGMGGQIRREEEARKFKRYIYYLPLCWEEERDVERQLTNKVTAPDKKIHLLRLVWLYCCHRHVCISDFDFFLWRPLVIITIRRFTGYNTADLHTWPIISMIFLT